jgi:hypothetical protein
MPKLLVIKTGSTMPELNAQRQDFEHWIVRSMDCPWPQLRWWT